MALPYHAYFFDADDTLFDYPLAEKEALESCVAHFAPQADPKAVLTAYRRHNHDLWKEYERGEVDQYTLRVERFRRVSVELRLPFPDCELVSEHYLVELSQRGYLFPGALALLRDVARYRPVVIVTNGISRVQRARFTASGILDHVSHLVISEEVGFAKPDPRIFDAVLSTLGLNAAEVLLIGDSITSDMTAAKRAGMDFCWYHPLGAVLPEEFRPVAVVDGMEALRTFLLESESGGEPSCGEIFLSGKIP